MTLPSEQLQQTSQILSTQSGGETILARVSDGCIFGLGEIGSLVWTHFAQPATLPDVIRTVARQCASFPAAAPDEIAAFVEELRGEGLLQPAPLSTEAAELSPAETPDCALVYVTPRLDRGTLRSAASGNSTFSDGGLTTSGNPGGVS